MGELLALTGRHVRTTLRSRGARVAAAGFVLALGLVAGLEGGARGGAGILLLGTLLLATVLVVGAAVSAGTALPEDRVAGREEWLATLAPPGWKRRLAVVLAGWSLTAGLGLAAGALVALAVGVADPDLHLRAWRPVPLQGVPVLGGRGEAGLTLALPAADASLRELEVDVRPIFPGFSQMPTERVEVRWRGGGQQGRLRASARGPLRFGPPPGTRALHLECLTPHVRLRLVAARRLGPDRPLLPTLAWTGLLLGLLAAAAVPVAVLVSRATSGQTAAAAAFSLLLLGTVKGGLLEIASRLDPGRVNAAVPVLLRVFARLAPDTPVFHLLAEASARRAPSLGALGSVAPALLYALVVAALACAPLPRRLAVGANA
jgi:hypothetical protein